MSQVTDGLPSALNKNCRKCKNPAKSGPKCVVCGAISHPSCVKEMKSIKVIDDKLIKCCEKSDIPTNKGVIADVTNSDVYYLKIIIEQKDIIIEQKDTIISNQSDLIDSLKQQLVLQKLLNEQNTKVLPPESRTPKVSKPISKQDVALACMEAQTSLKCDEVVQLSKPPSSDAEWRDVVHKKKMTKPKNHNKRTSLAIGNSQAPAGIKAVRPVKSLHVSRLDPSTDEMELTNYLKHLCAEIKVVKLNSKHPDIYSSFQLTVFSDNISKLLESSVWPEGVCVNKFFHPRSQPPNKT